MSLTYSDIVSPVIGRKINDENFRRIGSTGPDSLAVYNRDWMETAEFCSLFGLTDALYDKWTYSGIEFNIYLQMDGETIRRCVVDKFRETETARPRSVGLQPTQQELRIARRILDFTTFE